MTGTPDTFQLVVIPALVAGLVALVLSAVLPVFIKPVLVRLGIMDVPNHRSSHVQPVPRGLGLAVMIAMLAGSATALSLWFGLSAAGDGTTAGMSGVDNVRFLAVVALATLVAGLLGLGEDIRGVSVPVRSTVLLLLALAVAVILVWTPGSWTERIPLLLQLALVLYAILFLSSYINVANFMDGVNGISGFHGIVAGVTFACAGVCAELPWLVVAGLVLAAGFAGFLPWNLTKPGAFLGDVGSYLLGGAVATTSFAAFVAGVPILATIGPMICYFGDVGVTLVKRVRTGHKWDEPHKEHVYQRVQQLGYSHVAAAGIVAGFTALGGALGLLSFVLSPWYWLLLLAAGLVLVAVYVQLPRILPVRSAAE